MMTNENGVVRSKFLELKRNSRQPTMYVLSTAEVKCCLNMIIAPAGNETLKESVKSEL